MFNGISIKPSLGVGDIIKKTIAGSQLSRASLTEVQNRKGAESGLKKHKLKMLQGNACLHTSVATENFMKKKNVKVEFTPPTSPGFKVVKKLFWTDDIKACR